MIPLIDDLIHKLETHVKTGTFEQLETDTVEIKPVPSDGGSWLERYKSVCAFLNTRGGILLLGIKEVGTGDQRRYVHTGYDGTAEEKIKDLLNGYTSKTGAEVPIPGHGNEIMVRPFLDGQIVVVWIDELSADQKYVFYRSQAYKRILTGDHKIKDREIEEQEEYKEGVSQARELKVVEGVGLEQVDLDRLNEYIQELNRPTRIETIKADLASARTFLDRMVFIKGDQMTTLGVLVCGQNPADLLGFRVHLHGFVDGVTGIAQDKQDYVGSVLYLMESGYAYLVRNTLVGIVADKSGQSRPQYPDQLLRETINNALAHRDYAINRQIIVAIQPGRSFTIQNPGRFRSSLVLKRDVDGRAVRRILPEAKPRNPKLANVLRIYRKWEGRGIGMATLVSMALDNIIDLPYYLLKSEEVKLVIPQGKVLDERIEWVLRSFDRFILDHASGRDLTVGQKTVLAYLIKSEAANRSDRYTIHLSPENNHFADLAALEGWGLVVAHDDSNDGYRIHLAHSAFGEEHYGNELSRWFGEDYRSFHPMSKAILSVVYRFNTFASDQYPSAKQIANYLWFSGANPEDIAGFDTYYRRVRYFVAKMSVSGYLAKVGDGYKLQAQLPSLL